MAIDDSPPEDGLVHDDVEIEDFEYDDETDSFKYPCPCGDEFVVSRVSFNDERIQKESGPPNQCL